ncbi:helix-turn-helix domain-containing protein [Microseira sp. BLCC-F43]|jgi:hypothetical protein|uniref:helix-turn-helix domain-containing protein n=1 Tax=Microseira sp. BLCC-F43 TaxID=3153602 RepID=UPI0035B93A2F
MTHPRPLGERELALINLYAHCQLGLSPRQWDVTYKIIADICSRSPATVRRWFGSDRNYRAPSSCDLRHLALMDFLLEHREEIPTELFNLLCPHSRSEKSSGKTDQYT